MNWTVVYLDSADQLLVNTWIKALDRAAVTRAADLIDDQLHVDPYGLSQVRHANSRIMVEPPLAVGFDVNDDDRLVTVWAFWRT